MALDTTSAAQADAAREVSQGEVIVVEDLWKTYTMGLDQVVNALCGISLRIRHNEYVAIMGPSGSGKSTLMNLIGCLDTPTKGKYWLNGHLVSELNDDELARIRNREIGYVWQFHYLLPEFTALENVAMPLLTRGQALPSAEKEASRWLREVGLEARGHHRSGELSGGEQQRLALARALIT